MTQLEPGATAPNFTLLDQAGNEQSIRPGQNTILFFYPAAFTPGCTGEVCDFRDRTDRLADSGYQLYGISPDPVEKLAEFASEYELPYPLLSDQDHAVADSYGAWGVKKNYGKEYVGLIRSTVVVGESGLVQKAWYNVKATGHAERVTTELLD